MLIHDHSFIACSPPRSEAGISARSTLAAAWIVLLAGCSRGVATPPAGLLADGIGDPYYSDLGNPGYDVTHYTIALDVDPETNEVRGTTTIQAVALQALPTLNLDFQGLAVDEIQVDGSVVQYSRREHELTISPRRPPTAGHTFSVSVRYHGAPEPIPSVAAPASASGGRASSLVGWFHAPSGAINVLNEPNGAAGWFPVNDHPRDKATYRFEISVPDPWIVAASGTLLETAQTDGRTRYIWEMNAPMASYLASINVDKYTLESAAGPAGVRLRSYLPPGLSADLQANLSMLPQIMAFFDELFGPYPFDEYGVLVASDGIEACRGRGTAVEVQTLSIHCPDRSMLSDEALAHELAHQWFGDDVSLENWQDIWLKEGMATYAAWMWETRDRDLNGLTSFVRVQAMLGSHETSTGAPAPDDLYDDEVYSGGAQVFHALRLKIGDALFFKLLRTYLERYRYGNAGTDEFITLAQEVSGQDLSGFFDSWLTHTTVPEIPRP